MPPRKWSWRRLCAKYKLKNLVQHSQWMCRKSKEISSPHLKPFSVKSRKTSRGPIRPPPPPVIRLNNLIVSQQPFQKGVFRQYICSNNGALNFLAFPCCVSHWYCILNVYFLFACVLRMPRWVGGYWVAVDHQRPLAAGFLSRCPITREPAAGRTHAGTSGWHSGRSRYRLPVTVLGEQLCCVWPRGTEVPGAQMYEMCTCGSGYCCRRWRQQPADGRVGDRTWR